MDAIWSCSGFFTPQCHDVSLVSCLSRIEKAQTRPKCKLTGQLLLLHDEDGFQNPYEAKHGKHENLKMDSGRFLVSNWNEHQRSDIFRSFMQRLTWSLYILVKSPIHPSTQAEAKSSEVDWKLIALSLSDRPEVHPSPADSGGLGRDLGLGTSSTTSSSHRSVPACLIATWNIKYIQISMIEISRSIKKYQASKDGCCA